MGQIIDVGASVGVSLCPDHGMDSETLLQTADMAMYCAKDEGRGAFRLFTQDMADALHERVALEKDVREAIVQGHIRPFYQPLVSLEDNKLVGFEVLARWQHPARGDIGPDVFIPISEKLNLIAPLTFDLLRQACVDALAWPKDITISLNVSPLHLSDPLLPVKLLTILSETDFPPRRLEIEITETSLVADAEAARSTLSELQQIGIKIALDDFGTGYSSLYNLQDLNFDKVKIDRSFIGAMQNDSESAKIVSSVIELANNLGLPVIAEGIEYHQQVQEIVKRGGKYGQGFYFSKAVPATEATLLIQGAHQNKNFA